MLLAIGSLPPPQSPDQLASILSNMGYWPLVIYMSLVFGIPTLIWLKSKLARGPV